MSDDGNVFIAVDALKRLASEHATDPEWIASLDAMVAYATERGWVDEAGAIQAHCEWTG